MKEWIQFEPGGEVHLVTDEPVPGGPYTMLACGLTTGQEPRALVVEDRPCVECLKHGGEAALARARDAWVDAASDAPSASTDAPSSDVDLVPKIDLAPSEAPVVAEADEEPTVEETLASAMTNDTDVPPPFENT